MILLDRIRIRGFRGIRSLEMSLGPDAALIGPANAGKSTALEALRFAFGEFDGRLAASDFYDGGGRHEPGITVDLRFVPADGAGKRTQRFSEAWAREFSGFVFPDRLRKHEFFAFRTEASSPYGEVRRFCVKDWDEPENAFPLRYVPPAVKFIWIGSETGFASASRDPRSFVSRALSELLPESGREPGFRPAAFSEVRETLDRLSFLIEGNRPALPPDFQLSVTGLARLVRQLCCGDSRDGAVRLLSSGSGGRTALLLATVMLMRLVTEKSAEEGRPAHFVTAIAEPELHLHPNAQRSLVSQLRKAPGQLVMTTHSPFITSAVSPLGYRAMTRRGDDVRARWLPGATAPSEIRAIKRLILRNRSEALFARGLILAEGITEEQLFRGMFARYFGADPADLGVSVIGVEGKNYGPYMRLAVCLQKPFVIVSDNDGDTERVLWNQIEKLLAEQQMTREMRAYCGVYFLHSGNAFEDELIQMGTMNREIALAIARMQADESRRPADWTELEAERLMREPESRIRKMLKSSKSEYSAFLSDVIAENRFGKRASELMPDAVIEAFRTVGRWPGVC